MKKLTVTHNKKMVVFSLISPLSLVPLATASNAVDDYIDLSLADLLSMEVTSVKKAAWFNSPVVTNVSVL